MTQQPFYDDSIALSRAMQQRLQTRIAQHQGAVDAVYASVQAELATLDAEADGKTDADRSRYQSSRALLLGQLDYLTMVAKRQQEQDAPRSSGTFWSRFRRPFSRTPVAE